MAPRPIPGGGGLVILPHKSWNVWNQDNKAKVARDEAANKKLIEAKEECKRQTLQQIRFERLTGKVISRQEEEQRVQHALDNMDINDYIHDESMRDIAQNINDKKQREMEENDTSNNHNKNKKKKRKLKDMNLTEEQIKYQPRKRHKRNDVTIIEDHYNEKSKFKFDPSQYDKKEDYDYRKRNDQLMKKEDINTNSHSHFSLFNDSDLRNKDNRNGYKNQDVIKEERQKKEMEDYQFKFGRTELETRGRVKRPWYLMTNQRVEFYLVLFVIMKVSLHRILLHILFRKWIEEC